MGTEIICNLEKADVMPQWMKPQMILAEFVGHVAESNIGFEHGTGL
jgi:hypothetical protein